MHTQERKREEGVMPKKPAGFRPAAGETEVRPSENSEGHMGLVWVRKGNGERRVK